MNDEFHYALNADIMSLIEDAILSGGLDELVLLRAAQIKPCKARTFPVRRPRDYPRSFEGARR